ncbi:MAG: hypothetical protein AAB676_18455, partial [Verrucomicrobiota bacterium]
MKTKFSDLWCAFALAVTLPLAAAAATSITPGETKTGSITSVGQTDSYTFSANAGDTVTVLMGRSGGSLYYPQVELHAPDGTVVTSATAYQSATIQARRLNQAGTYLIVCRDSGGVNTGGYGVSLIKNPGPNVGDPEGGVILPGETKTGTITVGDLDAYAFVANAGDTVTVLMERGSSGF